MKGFKNKVRDRRKQLGLSQVELSYRTRIAAPNLSAIERGRLLPWDKAKESLCRILGMTESDLFE
ncbi:helix-turn-helix transcriptional regulator [Patescibacteria group bacterium]|nr:helix-turn-helix transcriptional regulator [Patescibacteria group bacterium]